MSYYTKVAFETGYKIEQWLMTGHKLSSQRMPGTKQYHVLLSSPSSREQEAKVLRRELLHRTSVSV